MANRQKNRPYTPPPAPRTAAEIQADFDKTLRDAGDSQYKAKVFEANVEMLNKKLYNLNVEMAERRKLDEAEKAGQ